MVTHVLNYHVLFSFPSGYDETPPSRQIDGKFPLSSSFQGMKAHRTQVVGLLEVLDRKEFVNTGDVLTPNDRPPLLNRFGLTLRNTVSTDLF